MATKAHKLLTGTDLHEPKGVETQPAGRVYVSNGAGSGTWVTINTDVGFSTGDVKDTFKTVPDTGWVLVTTYAWTIGSPTSGATYTSLDGQALYILLWNNLPPTSVVISGGRGGSAAADYAANKTLQPFRDYVGRSRAWAGTVNPASIDFGVWGPVLGNFGGSQRIALTAANLPAHTHSGTTSGMTSNASHSHSYVQPVYGGGVQGGGGSGTLSGTTGTTTSANIDHAHTFTTNGGDGVANTAVNVMGPTFYTNLMVKL